jgi:hypothetical protein
MHLIDRKTFNADGWNKRRSTESLKEAEQAVNSFVREYGDLDFDIVTTVRTVYVYDVFYRKKGAKNGKK